MSANDKQVAGDHYHQKDGEQHWDRIYRLYGRGYFVGCATKYIERYHLKNGKQDLEKAIHFLEKLIELEYFSNSVVIENDPLDLPELEESLKRKVDQKYSPDYQEVISAHIQKMQKMRMDAMTGVLKKDKRARPWGNMGIDLTTKIHTYKCMSCYNEISVMWGETPPDHCDQCGFDGESYRPLDKGYANQDGENNA